LRPASTIDVPSVSLLLAYAGGGVGIGLVPALPLQEPHLGAVSWELASVLQVPVKLVVRGGRRADPAVEPFVERLLAEAQRQERRLEAWRAGA
jgi:DNA-binding transcriptional LysR family regulator